MYSNCVVFISHQSGTITHEKEKSRQTKDTKDCGMKMYCDDDDDDDGIYYYPHNSSSLTTAPSPPQPCLSTHPPHSPLPTRLPRSFCNASRQKSTKT